MRREPAQWDAITHEAFHLVQSYPAGLSGCGYWVEGEADLARHWYGQNNTAAGWALPARPFAGMDYTAPNQYTTTGAFLLWMYENWGDFFVYAFHDTLKAGTCPNNQFWKTWTDFNTIGELWNGYLTGNPIPPTP